MNKKTIFVYSTKGGVGKSTLSFLLAKTLYEDNNSVSYIDLDFAGTNVPKYIQKAEPNLRMEDFLIRPVKIDGIYFSSINFIKSPEDITFLTGEYLHGALDQFIYPDLFDLSEYTIIDMPPGFNEVHRYMFSKYYGNIILVTTPHHYSIENLARGVRMIEKMNVPVIGIIENMTHVVCNHCETENELYERENNSLDYDVLEYIPFITKIQTATEEGNIDIKTAKKISNIVEEIDKRYKYARVEKTK